jgi:hypothetical protein
VRYGLLNEGPGLPRIASLVNEQIRMDADLDEEGNFQFINIDPGRYDLIIGESILLLPEVEVVPDLTTRVVVDSSSVKNAGVGPPSLLLRRKGRPERVIERFRFRTLFLNYSPIIYPDKTFSGSVFLSEEELRARRKPIELDLKRYKRFRGFVFRSSQE